MEPHNAVLLIIEYLRSPDAQVRRNALTALGCVPSEETFREIVRSALVDDEPKVRERAEDEILAAGNPPPTSLVAALNEQFGPSKLLVPAYTLIGSLRCRGVDIRLPRMSVLRRIKLVLASRRQNFDRPAANLRRSAFVGSIIGALALLLYINLTMRVNLGTPAALAVASAALILPLAIMFFTRLWWTPIQRQPDRLINGLLEILVLCLIGAVVAALQQGMFIAYSHSHATGVSIGIALAAGAASLGAVRLGTYVAHGCFRGAMLNRIAQICTGFAAGALVLTIILANIERGQSPAVVQWPLMLPILLGLACAFSAVDRESYITQSAQVIFRRASRPLTALLVAAVAMPTLFPLIPKKLTHNRESNSSLRIIPIESLPEKVELTFNTPQIVRLVVPEEKLGKGDFQIGLWRGGVTTQNLSEALKKHADSRAMDYQDDPTGIEELLSPGNYQVVVDGTSAESTPEDNDFVLSSVLPFITSRIAQGPRPSELIPVLCSLEISSRDADTLVVSAPIDVSQGPLGKASTKHSREEAEETEKEGRQLFPHSKYQAVAAFSRAIEIDPTYVEAYRLRAHTLSWLNYWGQAVSDINKVVETRPHDKNAYSDRAYYYEHLKQYVQELQDRSKVLQLAPNDSAAYVARGNAYEDLEQHKLALQDCNKGLQMDPDSSDAYVCIGNIYTAMGSYDDALQVLEKAIKSNPTDETFYNNYGYVLNHLGRYQKALEALNKAIELDPSSSRAYKNRGRSYLGLEKYNLAIENLNTSIKFEPELAEAYQFRGDTRNKMGDIQGANADWSKARELGYKPK
jgi:Tfp pilus assembly protein PilF